MSITNPSARRRRVAAALATGLLATSLAGCGAGRDAQTSQEVPAIPGADVDAGPIALRDLLVPFRAGGYPAGSDVPLLVHIVNDGEQGVTLTGVTPGPAGPAVVTARRVVVRDGSTVTALVVASQGSLVLRPGAGPYLRAEGISAVLPYGDAIAVRFTFSTGASVDVDVPMAPRAWPTGG